MLEYSVLFPEVKKKTAFLFGDNISLSYPMPDIINGIRVEKFFLYPGLRKSPEVKALRPADGVGGDGRGADLSGLPSGGFCGFRAASGR